MNQRPILIYDGDCGFCKFWIKRWRSLTGDKIEYAAYQEVGGQFPQISKKRFEESIQLVQPDGTVYSGARAVFQSLAVNPSYAWLFWLYQKLPLFRWASEGFYEFVAKNRIFFSKLTKLFLGKSPKPPTYFLTRRIFFVWLGLTYLMAFASLGSQMAGLYGVHGILPVSSYLESAQKILGSESFRLLPTLFWLNSSDLFLKCLCWSGAVLSLGLVFGVLSFPITIILWFFYLSLVTVGQDFLSFQWDVLLLETGFLSIFLAPLSWRLKANRSSPPSFVFILLMRWLLFRLMFSSGIVKLLSGDPTWRNWTALTYHYETQPLPTWIGWYVHHLPFQFHQFSTGILFSVELLVPFLFFLPRRPRIFAAAAVTILQVLIALTGNYCFFNFLTVGLCLWLIDDQTWPFRHPERSARWSSGGRPLGYLAPSGRLGEGSRDGEPIVATWRQLGISRKNVFSSLGKRIQGFVALILIVLSLGLSPLLHKMLRPFHLVNGYGLFAVMTTERPEIIVEGSDDGIHWLVYEFRYKPDDLRKKPAFAAPHQPRLDWQMWFAALSDYRLNPWFFKFCERLLEGSPDVLALLKKNPFGNHPPKYLRATIFNYHFSSLEAKRLEKVWWVREKKGLYCPVLSKSSV